MENQVCENMSYFRIFGMYAIAMPIIHNIGRTVWNIVVTGVPHPVTLALKTSPKAIGARIATRKKLTAIITMSFTSNPIFNFHLQSFGGYWHV